MSNEAVGEVNIILDGERQLLITPRTREGRIDTIAALPRGMTSGKAAVAIVGKLKDGGHVVLQTSLRVLLQAATALQSRYGIEADGASPASLDATTRDRINAAIMVKLIRDREGSEVTLDVGELNAMIAGLATTGDSGFEIQYAADGHSLTIRAKRSE